MSRGPGSLLHCAGDHHGVSHELPEFATGNPNKSIFEMKPEHENLSPIEQVNLTVPITDDPAIPIWTFLMWFLGLLICAILSLLNQFFYYRTEPLTISALVGQIAAMPMGRFMAATLPTKVYFRGTRFAFTLNPGPFNMKEHVLITIFAMREPVPYMLLGLSTSLKPSTSEIYLSLLDCLSASPLRCWAMDGHASIAIFSSNQESCGGRQHWSRTLHEPDKRPKGGLTRFQVFSYSNLLQLRVVHRSMLPVSHADIYVMGLLGMPDSILAQHLGSGLKGLGIDWTTTNFFSRSPLATPWFATANIAVGFFIVIYVLTPIAYWSNIYNAKTFPIFSSHLFQSTGDVYDVNNIIGDDFQLDIEKYNKYGKVLLSTFFAMTYSVGFAALSATLSHVVIFYGK